MSFGSSGPAIERRPLLLVDQHLTRCRHLTQCGALRIFNILSFMPHWHKPLLGRLNLGAAGASDRKSTRLNSSHLVISYAVFCLKKTNQNILLYEIYLNTT